MTLTEFLTARIDEDEAAARPFRNALGDVKPWRCDEVGGKVRQVGQQEFGLPDVVSESDTHLTAVHIARHDPARILAECEAKRQLIERVGNPDWAGFRILALPHADHPDYRPEWRP